MSFVVSLEEAEDVSKYGGKAANLAKLLEAELPVPDGFVLTTGAYRKYNPTVPKELLIEIEQAFDDLGAARVAVRSSAVAEDAGNASWAGQLETVLNVTRDELREAVEYCWKSMQSERAVEYAKEHDVSKDRQTVAVVMQAMVDSEKSGVMFTANPVTNDRNEMIIECIYGLGELLVQGTETPESFILSKSGKVKEHELHQQNQKLEYQKGRNELTALTSDQKDKPILSDGELKKLVDLGNAVETYYGKPQDIEWAIAENKVWLVQTRPITTLDRGRHG